MQTRRNKSPKASKTYFQHHFCDLRNDTRHSNAAYRLRQAETLTKGGEGVKEAETTKVVGDSGKNKDGEKVSAQWTANPVATLE